MIKGNYTLPFELYTDKPVDTGYRFYLDSISVCEFLLSSNVDDLKIHFHDPDKKGDEKNCIENVFSIEGIYNTQKDLVEEMITKVRIYDDAYCRALINSQPILFSNPDFRERVLWGNYCNPDEIHKRPMAKFTQDIKDDIKRIVNLEKAD